jgi:hypothetical protein
MSNNWPLVVGNTLLILLAIGGGVATLARRRSVGGTATALAAVGCGLLFVVAVAELVFWVGVVPSLISNGDPVLRIVNVASLLDSLILLTTFALLIGAVHASRRPAPVAGSTFPAYPVSHPPGYGSFPPGGFAGPVPAAAPPAASGWTPPRQAEAADWNHMSGVWSIPPGTFDGPPPEHRQ